jgi:Transposase DDE domain
LGLCRQAGLVSVGVIAIDGTKVAANASREANRSYEQIAREILAEAEETDRREDELYGEARGDELAEQLRTSAGRRAALREAKAKLEREAGREAQPDADEAEGAGVEIELDPERFVTRSHGRRAWFREARRELDEQREQEARPIARSRLERLGESARRLEEELAVEHMANAAYGAWRQRGVAADGSRRMAPGTTKPYRPPELPAGTINTTDPDSRLVKTVGQRALQGYNAQAAVNEHQIIVAAEVTVDSPDFGHLEPMVDATQRELAIIGAESPAVVVADAGYWHKRQMENVVERGIQVLIPPDSGLRKSARPGWDGGLYAFMRRVLSTDQAKALYRKRQTTIEPVFGQMKFNRGFDRFGRRGRSACRSEWRLFGASHNLLKLHSHRIVAAAT